VHDEVAIFGLCGGPDTLVDQKDPTGRLALKMAQALRSPPVVTNDPAGETPSVLRRCSSHTCATLTTCVRETPLILRRCLSHTCGTLRVQ